MSPSKVQNYIQSPHYIESLLMSKSIDIFVKTFTQADVPVPKMALFLARKPVAAAAE